MAQHSKDNGDLEAATRYCTRLLDYPGPEKDAAKAMMREIRSMESNDQSMSSMVMSPGGSGHDTSGNDSLFSPFGS